ncbi:unnamed protein product, partial [Closterium sp. NIES-64]
MGRAVKWEEVVGSVAARRDVRLAVLHALRRKRVEEAVDLICSLAGLGLSPRKLAVSDQVYQACVAASNLPLVMRFILHLPSASSVDYNKALKECARQGKLQLALTLFHALRKGCRAGGSGGGDSSSNRSSSGGTRESPGEDSLPPGVSPEVLPEEGALPEIAPGVEPDMFTYRSMMDVCAACGAGTTAAEIIQAMVEEDGVGVRYPTTPTRSAEQSSQHSMLVLTDTRSSFPFLLAPAPIPPSPAVAMVEEDGVVPNTYVVNSALNACISDWDATWSLWFRMERLGVSPDATTFNTLLKACAAHCRPDAAQLLYEQLRALEEREERAGGNHSSRQDRRSVCANVVTWTSLIGACVHAGFVDHAFRVFDEMVGSGCEATTAVYNLMIDMCAEAGLEDRAVALLREMQAGGRSGKMRAGEERGDEESGVEQEVSVVAASSPSSSTTSASSSSPPSSPSICAPDIITFNTVIKACTGSPQRARAFVGEMRAAGIAPNERTWVALLDCHGTNADTAAAVQAFQGMQAAGFKADVVAYTAVIKACIRGGDWDRAFGFYDQMKAEGVRPNL